MGEDKRRRSRSKCRIEAVVEAEGAPAWSGPCRDVSLNGLFLTGPGKARPGAACSVKITLVGIQPPIVLTIGGRVARVDKEGTAVAFEAMNEDALEHLGRIVLYNSKDPDQVLREMKDRPGWR